MDKNDTYRKPNTGMLEQLYYQYKVESKDECIMIGDASGKSGDFQILIGDVLQDFYRLY